MNRRGFLGRLAAGLATAALAAHMEFGSLVPVLAEPARAEKWFYLVEVTDRQVRNGLFTSFVSVQHVWLEEKELASHGLKPEDFLSLEPGQRLGPAKAYINGRNVEALGPVALSTCPTVLDCDMDRDIVTSGVTLPSIIDGWIETGELT